MKESDIVYENAPYFVLQRKSRDAQIAPLESTYFQLFRSEGMVSVNQPFYVSSNLERAKKACDYWASRAPFTIKPNGEWLVKR